MVSRFVAIQLPRFGRSDALFGYSTQTLANGLGNGGLNPLYQIGGPRSVQMALKLTVLISRGFLECVLGGFRTDPQHHASVDLSSLEPLENIVNRFERLRLDDRLHLAFGGKAQRFFQI
jgi:hypothetical protein